MCRVCGTVAWKLGSWILLAGGGYKGNTFNFLSPLIKLYFSYHSSILPAGMLHISPCKSPSVSQTLPSTSLKAAPPPLICCISFLLSLSLWWLWIFPSSLPLSLSLKRSLFILYVCKCKAERLNLAHAQNPFKWITPCFVSFLFEKTHRSQWWSRPPPLPSALHYDSHSRLLSGNATHTPFSRSMSIACSLHMVR